MNHGIEITSITAQEYGWPIAAHCSRCRKTVIKWSPYASNPKDVAMFMIEEFCADDDVSTLHNLLDLWDYVKRPYRKVV